MEQRGKMKRSEDTLWRRENEGREEEDPLCETVIVERERERERERQAAETVTVP